MRKNWLYSWLIPALIFAWTACSDDSPNLNAPDSDASAKKKIGKFDPLSVDCGVSGKSTITVTIMAGASGAPAGFSLQWMTAADFDTYGWNEEFMCKGSFSGNAKNSRYRLGSNESVELTVGDLEYDNGASTSCPDFLECGTEYVFRTFAHATSSMFRSDFSQNYSCSTAACESNCPYGFGHWKNNPDDWPVDVLELGNHEYTKEELLAIMDLSVGGNPQEANALIRLAHHLIAAMLNVADGATLSGDIVQTIADADDFIGDYLIPDDFVASNTPEGQTANDLKDLLEAYNNGVWCGAPE
jgi:hypothetical protein